MKKTPVRRPLGLTVIEGLAGVGLCLLLALSRLPALYDGLWQDEVHYNIVPLSAASFSAFRDAICWLMRPMLDLALRKWVWFSPFGLAVTERNLALVAWLIATAHLLILVCLPWSPYWALRVIAGLLLGFCAVEVACSTEAQGYSLVSLASTLLVLGFYATTRQLKQQPRMRTLLFFLSGFAVCLNAHYFSWPFALLMLVVLAVYLATDPDLTASRMRLAGGLLLAGAVTLALTIHLNKPSLMFLLTYVPSPTTHLVWNWVSSLSYVKQAWRWLGLPGLLYLPIVGFGLLHPRRDRRYLAWGLAAAALGLKFVVVALISAKSTYPIHDRYLVMFISPAILAFALGLESIALRADRLGASIGSSILVLALVAWIGQAFPRWGAVAGQAREGIAKLRATPGNYSAAFQFFEKAKSFRRPLLVLTNDCRTSDVPRFYLQFLGRPADVPTVILN
ncbi:MAG: hypothetical protein DMG07_01500, partial [Acidobacteria bacterium]